MRLEEFKQVIKKGHERAIAEDCSKRMNEMEFDIDPTDVDAVSAVLDLADGLNDQLMKIGSTIYRQAKLIKSPATKRLVDNLGAAVWQAQGTIVDATKKLSAWNK